MKRIVTRLAADRVASMSKRRDSLPPAGRVGSHAGEMKTVCRHSLASRRKTVRRAGKASDILSAKDAEPGQQLSSRQVDITPTIIRPR